MERDQYVLQRTTGNRSRGFEELLLPLPQGQVVLRCTHINTWLDLLCIDPGTHLIDRGSGEKSWLVHAEGIPLHPEHVQIEQDTHLFLLIFQPLPAGCSAFDLIEPCQGGYEALQIQRNGMDVYQLTLR